MRLRTRRDENRRIHRSLSINNSASNGSRHPFVPSPPQSYALSPIHRAANPREKVEKLAFKTVEKLYCRKHYTAVILLPTWIVRHYIRVKALSRCAADGNPIFLSVFLIRNRHNTVLLTETAWKIRTFRTDRTPASGVRAKALGYRRVSDWVVSPSGFSPSSF